MKCNCKHYYFKKKIIKKKNNSHIKIKKLLV